MGLPPSKELGALAVSYTLAYVVGTLVINYVLNVPGWLTEAHDLVREFYIKNGIRNFLVEWLVVGAYVFAAHIACGHAKARSNFERFLVTIATVVALSSAFWLLFTRVPSLRGSFYERWFRRAGLKAVVFDTIYIGAVYVLFQKMYLKFEYHNMV